MKTLYLECNMGAAGDMLMGALYEICQKKELFLKNMNEAFAPFGVSISAEPSRKCGITGTHMKISIGGREEGVHSHSHHDSEEAAHSHSHHDLGEAVHSHSHHDSEETAHSHSHHDSEETAHSHSHSGETHVHRNYPALLKEIRSLALPEEVKDHAVSIYTLLGNAEAKVHQTTLEQIHFHEVGSLDALADVVGCCYLFYLIAPEEILCSPIHLGSGFVKCAHGVLSVPAPATAELLKGIPSYAGSIAGELCTPTGAAILRHFAAHFTTMPPLSVDTIGYGMGVKDFEIANCVRAFLGKRFQAQTPDFSAETDQPEKNEISPYDDTVLSISCNLDDMTGEAIGLAAEILLESGALDVYTSPIQMKKNRPGVLLTCLCPPEEREKFTELFFLHTTTRGVRCQMYGRAKLESSFETRRTSYGEIRVKKSTGYGVEKEKPEFDDLKAIVQKHHYSVSLEEVQKQCGKLR